MTTFTIDSADRIATTTGTHKPEGTDHFGTLDELGHLAELWPAARLVSIWNSLPGATAVTKGPVGQPFAVQHFHANPRHHIFYPLFSVGPDRIVISLDQLQSDLWMMHLPEEH